MDCLPKESKKGEAVVNDRKTSDEDRFLVSVVVPVFNVEPYIDECVSSIMRQTYENLEVILVDDGSTDSCPDICDAWAERDSRVRVIHRENGGLAAARNTGLDAMTGEYVAFVDSDDWVAPDYVESLYSGAVESGADLSICGSIYAFDDGSLSSPGRRDLDVVLGPAEAFRLLSVPGAYGVGVCDKLYSAELVADLRFPEAIRTGEDYAFTLAVMLRASRVKYSSTPLYYYRMRSGSLSNGGGTLTRSPYDAGFELLRIVRERFPEYERYAAYGCMRWAIGSLSAPYARYGRNLPCEWGKMERDLRAFARDNWRLILSAKPSKARIAQFWVFAFASSLYPSLHRLVKRLHPRRME